MSFGKWFAEKRASGKDKAAGQVKPAPGTKSPATRPDSKPAEVKSQPKQ